MKRLALRKIDLIIYCICILAALASLVAGIIIYNRLPAEIPTQFGLTGKIGGYGSRSAIFTFPAFELFMLPVLVIVSMFPVCWNVPGVTITEANAPRLGACVRNMLNTMLVLITATMTTLFVCQVKNCNAPSFLLPALLVLFLIAIIVTIVRTRIIAKNS